MTKVRSLGMMGKVVYLILIWILLEVRRGCMDSRLARFVRYDFFEGRKL